MHMEHLRLGLGQQDEGHATGDMGNPEQLLLRVLQTLPAILCEALHRGMRHAQPLVPALLAWLSSVPQHARDLNESGSCCLFRQRATTLCFAGFWCSGEKRFVWQIYANKRLRAAIKSVAPVQAAGNGQHKRKRPTASRGDQICWEVLRTLAWAPLFSCLNLQNVKVFYTSNKSIFSVHGGTDVRMARV